MSGVIKDVPIMLGSFAFRYAIGFGNFKPEKPMAALDFLVEARNLGMKGVQLCENLNYANLSDEEFYLIKSKTQELGLEIEIGMKNLNRDNLKRHLAIAERLYSNFIRVVLGNTAEAPEEEPQLLTDSAIELLKEFLPYLEKNNICIGIENHFDVPTEELLRLVREVDSKFVGLIFDSTNAIGFVEHPEKTLAMMKPNLISIHLKDYKMKKVEAGYMMTGTVLGEGWLDTEGMLREIAECGNLKSIVIEMTIRREEGRSMDDIIEWELESIRKSVQYLKELKINGQS